MKEAILDFTVSELNCSVQHLLESAYPYVSVVGEISNFVCPRSMHWYFSLKDEQSEIRCVMFKGQNQKIKTAVENGLSVQVFAKVTLYPNRGDYQLIVHDLQLGGEGRLQQAYQQLLKKLESLGWFDASRKKSIPSFPSEVGLITSQTGAAIRDILSVLKRRCPLISVVIYPTEVQGKDAKYGIARAILDANRRNTSEVLILARGGGSLEDLWPFNEEIVARAILDSEIPIVTGIGHEIDFTIADFVADMRASTPSAAAELVSKDQTDLLKQCLFLKQRLEGTMMQKIQQRGQALDWLNSRLKHPKEKLALYQEQFKNNLKTLIQQMKSVLSKHQNRFSLVLTELQTKSPLATLARGYSILTYKNSNEVISKAEQVKIGDEISVTLHKGQLTCSILEV